jgi:hypothetical protein
MQFCLQCGASLANAPFVVNFQGGGQQPPPTPSQPNTPFGQPAFQNQFQNQFSNVPPSRPKSNSKMFLAIGGIFALFLLLFAAGAAIFIYNYAIKDDPIVANTSTPSPARTDDKSPSPSSSSTPKSSPTSSPFGSNTSINNNNSGVKATFTKQWVDYNITEKGRTGMRIHTTFSVSGIKGVDSFLALYFAKKDGTKLSSNNSEYRSKDGQVAIYRALKPNYDETVYNDLTVFIPYDEFNLTRGKYDLQIDSDVIYENGDTVGHLNFYDFEYEKY